MFPAQAPADGRGLGLLGRANEIVGVVVPLIEL